MRSTLIAALLAASLVAACSSTAEARKAKVAAKAEDPNATYAQRADVREFAQQVATRQGWPVEWVESQLASATLQPSAQRLMMPPPAGSAKNWAAYRGRFVEAQRIATGARFWQDNADWLRRAEERFGVPPEIVVGIIGVETFYGRILGNFRVLDVLATLSFDFPSGRSDRSPFFREELEAFLRMCRQEGLEPAAPRGSYAGAMGLPQFMPSSVNAYAVDFDGDGRIDLTGSAADAIGSVANFLAAHGWQRGMPITFDVAVPVDTRARAALLAPDIVPTFSVTQMAELGAELEPLARVHDGPLALVELQNGDAAPSFVAGTQNFYSLTRYNWSSYYAMAVIALGQAVKQAR